MLKKLLPYLVFACVTLGLGYAAYRHGYSHGSQEVRLAWEQDKVAAQEAQAVLVQKLAEQEEEHRNVQRKIADELAQARADHDAAVARLRADADQRLLQSARRAAMYQRQAQAGAAASRDLASHAARLDRALEEGLELVGELTRTLGLRERQLILLSDQIRNDRRAIEGDVR